MSLLINLRPQLDSDRWNSLIILITLFGDNKNNCETAKVGEVTNEDDSMTTES